MGWFIARIEAKIDEIVYCARETLYLVRQIVGQLVINKEIDMPSKTLAEAIQALTASVAEIKTEKDSAIAFIKGVPDLIAKAKSDALAAGASADQLGALDDLGAQLHAAAADVGAAIVANTPSAPAAGG